MRGCRVVAYVDAQHLCEGWQHGHEGRRQQDARGYCLGGIVVRRTSVLPHECQMQAQRCGPTTRRSLGCVALLRQGRDSTTYPVRSSSGSSSIGASSVPASKVWWHSGQTPLRPRFRLGIVRRVPQLGHSTAK